MSMKPIKTHKNLPSKWEVVLMNEISKEHSSVDIGTHIKVDGKKLFLLQMLFGKMSSSSMLEILIERYGFNEIQNDINWLKSRENK